jgi:hypothetical protein
MIDQDASHHPRGDPEEMGTILPGDVVLPHQTQIGLMHERGWLQRVVRSLAPQIRPCPASELAIHEGHQIFTRLEVPFSPRSKKLTHLARLLGH